MPRRILLADDHDLFRAGLRSILDKDPDLQVVGEAADGPAAVRLATELRPDVLLLDLTMPGLNGVEAARRIAAQAPHTRVVMLSMHGSRPFVTAALAAGAAGYLLKNSACGELRLAIDAVCQGQRYLSPRVAALLVDAPVAPAGAAGAAFACLTPREREVLQLLSEGKSNKEVADALHLGTRTVETHRARIMQKLGIDSVAGLTKYALRHGLTSLEA